MQWIIVLLVAAAVLALVRVVMTVRRARSSKQDDWDARMVRDLRASGANAFTPYEIDFFFTLPNEQACGSLRARLEPEGFSIDTRSVAEAPDGQDFSLHASKRLRISASEMHEHSLRFQQLATELGGHYDGWTTDPSRV